MSTPRVERVQEAIRQEVSVIIQNEIKDPRLGFCTVTKVELTPDLRYAKVFFSTLGERKDKFLALKGLNSAKGYIKGLLADRLKLRFATDLDFRVDDGFDKARTVLDILDKIKKEEGDKKRHEESNRGDQEA